VEFFVKEGATNESERDKNRKNDQNPPLNSPLQKEKSRKRDSKLDCIDHGVKQVYPLTRQKAPGSESREQYDEGGGQDQWLSGPKGVVIHMEWDSNIEITEHD
jgi:hypothetical protein